MRTSKLVINGREWPLCYSTMVELAMGEKFGGLMGFSDALAKRESVREKADALGWAIEEMLTAGAEYERLCGGEPRTDWPRGEKLLSLLNTGEMMRTFTACVSAGLGREVEAELPKNATATDGT